MKNRRPQRPCRRPDLKRRCWRLDVLLIHRLDSSFIFRNMTRQARGSMDRTGSETRLNEIDERRSIGIRFAARDSRIVDRTSDHHRRFMPETTVAWDFKFDRINPIIKRKTFDDGLKHGPEMFAATSGPSELDPSDPSRKIGTFDPDSNDSSTGFQFLQSTADTIQKIHDREFDRLTCTNRAIEFNDLGDRDPRPHRIEHQWQPSHRLIQST
jgi:hypothetical protein